MCPCSTISVLDMLPRQHVFWTAVETVPGEGCRLSVHLLEPESGDTLVLKTGAEFSSDGEGLRPCGAQWMAEGADRLYSVFVCGERERDGIICLEDLEEKTEKKAGCQTGGEQREGRKKTREWQLS